VLPNRPLPAEGEVFKKCPEGLPDDTRFGGFKDSPETVREALKKGAKVPRKASQAYLTCVRVTPPMILQDLLCYLKHFDVHLFAEVRL